MTRRFQQLQPEERIALSAMRRLGHSQNHIAKQLGRSPSTNQPRDSAQPPRP
jgi:IS30 family transposase